MSLISRLLGRTLASTEESGQRIGPLAAVPVLGLDALSSAAYGPEAALTVLLAAGVLGLTAIGPITVAVVALLAVVFLSYLQTIRAYPQGGGSYTVAGENLGRRAGLLAAAALILDYVLNVAVGISAGVGALVSAFPGLIEHRLALCLALLALIALVNLRGVREAGVAFMLPTVLFVLCLGAVIALGVVHALLAGGHPVPVVAPPTGPAEVAGGLGVWLLLRAFASGCTAMTGVEAVSNGVTTFRAPAVKSAQVALTLIVAILAALLLGVAFLARAYGVHATDPAGSGYQSVLSMLIAAVTGRGWFYYLASAAILAVLCLSANTSFAGLPRVLRLLAADDFLPHAFAARGRRLVFSLGIVVLTVLAGALLIVFGGVTDRLIPLFAIGAFLAFTLSQAGMVVHWRRVGRGGWPLWVNLVGAISTGVTLLIVLVSKFTEGAWVTVVIVPLVLLAFTASGRHYAQVRRETASDVPLDDVPLEAPVVIVPIRGWDAVSRKALRFARRLSSDVRAVHINIDGTGDDLRARWETLVGAPSATAPRLVLIDSPYRKLLEPLEGYIRDVEREHPEGPVVVVVPELVEARWFQYLWHNQRAAALKARLYFGGDRRVVVVNVPWYLRR